MVDCLDYNEAVVLQEVVVGDVVSVQIQLVLWVSPTFLPQK